MTKITVTLGALIFATSLGMSSAVLAKAPGDPYFLELKGQILLEAGKPQDALDPLRRATELTGNQPLIICHKGQTIVIDGGWSLLTNIATDA